MNPRFFYEFFKHPLELGAVFESGPVLVKSVCEKINGKRILELGAGRGPITRGILRVLPEDGKLISLEINPYLYSYLEEIKDKRFTPLLADATALEDLAIENHFDCIVSGLPLSNMDYTSVDNILGFSSQRKRFIQYKYRSGVKLLSQYFNSITSKNIWFNLPPAVVYTCSNVKTDILDN
jgi:phosphatidylethanolamine/phosphatidyl-N-methylethanolamine N-methyltransferase